MVKKSGETGDAGGAIGGGSRSRRGRPPEEAREETRAAPGCRARPLKAVNTPRNQQRAVAMRWKTAAPATSIVKRVVDARSPSWRCRAETHSVSDDELWRGGEDEASAVITVPGAIGIWRDRVSAVPGERRTASAIRRAAAAIR